MNLPKLDLSLLPDLDTLTGLFGTLPYASRGHDDTVVVLATFIFEASA